ncbi:hypothetical protein V9G51_001982 [Vibrio cholerae]
MNQDEYLVLGLYLLSGWAFVMHGLYGKERRYLPLAFGSLIAALVFHYTGYMVFLSLAVYALLIGLAVLAGLFVWSVWFIYQLSLESQEWDDDC